MRRAVPRQAGGQIDKVVGLIMFWLSFVAVAVAVAVALLAGADLVRAVIAYCDRVLGGGS